MSRKKKNNFTSLELDKRKYVVVDEEDGSISIYNITPRYHICIVNYKSKDQEYARNCIMETLDYLKRDI